MIRNIIICTTQVPFTVGGAEAHVLNLKKAFIDSGYKAEIVALPFKWYPPQQIMRDMLAWRLLDLTESNGVSIDLMIGMKFPAYAATHPNKVLWLLHQHRTAYELCGTEFDDLCTHPEGARITGLIREFDTRFIPTAKKVFTNSKTVSARLRAFNNIKGEPLYHPPPHHTQFHCEETGDYIFYPSRLDPMKRQELLIEAMRYVSTPVRAVLAGTAHDIKPYKQAIAQHGVEGRVELRGYVTDEEMIKLYANALGVCYLPIDEDYGYVTLEAMFSHKAVVVAADAGGAIEFVEHGTTGFIVEPDAHQLAERIDELYNDRQKAKRMGAEGRAKILSLNLSWENVVERLISAAR